MPGLDGATGLEGVTGLDAIEGCRMPSNIRWEGDDGMLNERLGAAACGDAACLELAWDWGVDRLLRESDAPLSAAMAAPLKTMRTRHAAPR